MANTRGIHVIWTTYGTWLPGDPRGHWSSLYDVHSRLHEGRHQLNKPDRATLNRARALMKEPAKVLTNGEIEIVRRTIAGLLARGMPGAMWTVRAAAIEPTHVHLLFAALAEDIARVVGRLKSQTASSLLKLPTNQGRCRIWTAGYWKMFLFDDEAMQAVRRYVEGHAGGRGLADPPREQTDLARPFAT